MTPEEHFKAASEHLLEANSTNNTARFWAQMRVSEHHTALGRAKSEHEGRKAFAAERARATIPMYPQAPAPITAAAPGPIPAERARDLMAQMQPGHTLAWDHDIKALNETINTVTEARDRALVAKAELAGKVDDLSAACAQKDQEIIRLLSQQREYMAKSGEAYDVLQQKWAERRLEIGSLNYQLRQKETHLTDLGGTHKAVSKQWTERGDRILTLEQEIKALKDKLAKFTSPDQPTPLTDGLPAVPEGFFRLVIDCPVDVVYEVADFDPIRTRLVDVEGDPVKVHVRRTFGSMTGCWKWPWPRARTSSGVIYGACRPATQVWRTPETTRWRGSRSGWEIEYDAPSEVTAVYVRSVDYPGTDEVGVDLVMRPKDAAENEVVGHDRLVLLQRQVMTEEAWLADPRRLVAGEDA